MNKLGYLLVALTIIAGCATPDFQNEEIVVNGTSQPVISLNGIWKLTLTPPVNFYSTEVSFSGWNNINVPGECAIQGFAIKHNTPFVYRRSFKVPEDYSDKTIKLRFEGVYSYARVWVNGVYIRDHSGGFTPWECNITKIVRPGNDADITVEVTDMDTDISYASGNARHQIGGILRNVSLMALPQNFPESINIQTDLDTKYTDARLKIRIASHSKEKSWISFRLYDMKGIVVKMTDKKFPIEDTLTFISIPVKNPDKWDSEHPNLYTLVTSVFDKRVVTASTRTGIGFREIEVKGNQLLVNGHSVKLRGANRYDFHPVPGRISTQEYDETDVILAREANMNFIRTSHYSPSETFLKFCDKYGIYVEDETAVCSADTHRGGIDKPLKQSEPGIIPQTISQVMEMVTNHINHPSVIIWSLGNDSTCNESFKELYDLVIKADSTRPIIFSYPGSLPDSVKCYDLYEGPTKGYGEWGITDTLRREKPEFWNTKKAYSPIKIYINEITGFKPGRPLEIPVYNRFDHTNMKEITTKWTYRDKEHLTGKDNIPPNEKGKILLFLADWTEGEYINIKFFRNDTSLIDEYNIRLGKRKAFIPVCEAGNIKTEKIAGGKVKINTTGFSAILNLTTGLLEDVVSKNDTLIKSGPWLHYRYPSQSHG
jgi:hypothetical protein